MNVDSLTFSPFIPFRFISFHFISFYLGIKRALEANQEAWVNVDSEIVDESARAALPLKSIALTRSLLDCLRLLKNVYIAIFVTSFVVATDYRVAEVSE